jgi:ankyrin repeat protein
MSSMPSTSNFYELKILLPLMLHPKLLEALNMRPWVWSLEKSAFMAVIQRKHDKIVKFLSDSNIDINLQDEHGKTSLMRAIYYGELHSDIALMLLDLGAEVNLKDSDGRTALMIAARNGSTKIVKALLARGAEVNAKDNVGQSALTWAALGIAQPTHAKTVKILINAGASLNFKTPEHRVCYHSAAAPEIRPLLKKAESNAARARWKNRRKLILFLVIQSQIERGMRSVATPEPRTAPLIEEETMPAKLAALFSDQRLSQNVGYRLSSPYSGMVSLFL